MQLSPPVHLHRRPPLNLQVQLAVHVPQGVAGQAGNQLPGARDPGPTQLFPLHGGLGPDLPERTEKAGQVLRPRKADRVSHCDGLGHRLSFSPLMVIGRQKGRVPSHPLMRAPIRGLVSHSPVGHGLDTSPCLLVDVVHAESPQPPR